MAKENELRRILEARGTSQAWLARKTGLGVGTVNEIVQQKRAPTLENARKIAKALGVRVEEIWPEE